MSTQPIANSAGYDNLSVLGSHTLWTCGAFTLGSVIGPFFFRNFNVKTHIFFGGVAGLTGNLITHNNFLKKVEAKVLEFDPAQEETLKKIAKAIQGTFICATSLLLARGLTSWFFEKMSYSHMILVGGLYNSAIGLATLHGYQYCRKL